MAERRVDHAVSGEGQELERFLEQEGFEPDVLDDKPVKKDPTKLESAEETQCVHHWEIDAPDGPESIGVCMHCGILRSFKNGMEAVMWERTNTLRNYQESYTERYTTSGSESFRREDIRLSDE